MLKALAGLIARSPLLAHGRGLYARNRLDWNLPLSKLGKLQAGLYIILEDYSKGLFPPTFSDQQAAYQGEIDYRASTGLAAEHSRDGELRKPFWNAWCSRKYLADYVRVAECLERCGVRPPARLLELGCGTGWMAEFLAITGYEVMGTSLVPEDIQDARNRIASVRAKGLKRSLNFEVAPMETVAESVGPVGYYDCVFMFEALHHAFDWRKSLDSAFRCLKPGGTMLVCCEPNLVHTFSSYRVAKLSNTHEIGFSRGELMRHFRQHGGFSAVRYLRSPFHFWCKHHWLCARRSSG
jgi:2-polyprenyl-3-methyl-5-hydroxy-6-metoxy-1,4-benzoquinol methylase